MSRARLLFTAAIVLLLTGPAAHAACTSPAAEAGAREYFSGPKVHKLCDGTDWVNFKTSNTLTACSAPQASRLEWDGAESAFKYCDGSNFIKVSPECTISSLTYKSKLVDATNLAGPIGIHLSPSGDKAYVMPYMGGKVAVLDISQAPSAPTLLGVGAGTTFADNSQSAVMVGNYLFATSAASDSVVSFNLTTNTPPYVSRVQASPVSEMNNVWGIAAGPDPNYVYTVSYSSGATANKCFFHVVNISNPAAMTIAGKLNVTDAGGGYANCNSVRVKGSIAYLNSEDGAIFAVDVSRPALPSYLGRVVNANLAGSQGFDFTKDGAGIVGSTHTNNRFNTFNISNPLAMAWVATITNASIWVSSYFTKVVGDYAFTAADGSDAVAAVNVSNLASPVVSAQIIDSTNLNSTEHLAVRGRYIFTANYASNQVAIVDAGCDPTPAYTQGACSPAGKMEYFPATRTLAYCDGSNYRVLAQPDVTPDLLDWENFLDISPIQTIRAIASTVDLRFSYVNSVGTPTVQYRKNGGAWTTFTTGSPATVSVTNKDSIEFQVSGTTGHAATITVTNLTDSSAVLDTVVGTVDHNYFYYVPYSTPGTIGVFSVSSTGVLTQISGSPFAGPANIYSLTIDPQGKFLYATSYSGNSVRVYNINQTTGALGAEITGSPYSVTAGPTQLHITADGKFLYVGTYTGSSIHAFTINSTTGALTQASGSPYAVASGYIADVQSDPAAKFLYATADANTNNLYGYSINATTGQLTALASFPKTPGRTPQTVAFDGTGSFVYTANWGDNNIGAYSFNSTTGALTLVAGSPFATGNRPNSVVTDKAGKVLFSGNSTSDTITTFKINASTGALTSIVTGTWTGNNPWEVALDPRGKFIYSVNNSGNNLTALTFEPTGPTVKAIPGSPFATGNTPQTGDFAKIPRP